MQIGFWTDSPNGFAAPASWFSWIGDLDEVASYGTALSADKGMQHYQRKAWEPSYVDPKIVGRPCG